MGCDIAALFAAGNWQVCVYEPVARARDSFALRLSNALPSMRARHRVTLRESLQDLPWREIALVVEAAPEKLALKQDLFKQIDALAQADAVLTTNTSSLRLAGITRHVKNKSRVAGVHFSTPATIAPLVEVVRGEVTSAHTIRTINSWLQDLGKLTVNLTRDVPGMLVNRVQGALMREAFSLIDRGIATPEDIDTAVRYGFGFRYIACGPLRQRDLNGLEIHRDAAVSIYPTLNNGKGPPRCLDDLVRKGNLGIRSGKGFYSWNPATLKQQLANYDQTLAEALKLMARRAKTGFPR
jgi:3-hydroxybutyryl-CoA dehydrogenase